FEFCVQRFAKQEDIRLARRICRITGRRFITEHAGDQKDMPGSALHHVGCKSVRELRKSENIQLQHLKSVWKPLIEEVTIEAANGIFIEDVDSDTALIETRLQLQAGSGTRKIDSFDQHMNTMLLPKFFGQLLHGIRVTRSENEVCLTLR